MLLETLLILAETTVDSNEILEILKRRLTQSPAESTQTPSCSEVARAPHGLGELGKTTDQSLIAAHRRRLSIYADLNQSAVERERSLRRSLLRHFRSRRPARNTRMRYWLRLGEVFGRGAGQFRMEIAPVPPIRTGRFAFSQW